MAPSPPPIKTFSLFAENLADQARTLSLAGFRHELTIKLKDDESPVTAIDQNVETMLRDRIREAYPDHGILGEEHGSSHTDAEYVWSIDPIDGTRSFVTGWPLWGTLLALLRNGEPLLGLIDMPVLNERWIGISGEETTFNGAPCKSRANRQLSDSTIYATSPDVFSTPERAVFEQISEAAKGRRFGGDCYSYALLAAGYIDAVVESDLKPYDYLALVPVIQAAGGVITDWRGQPLGMHSGGRVVAAASMELHREIIALTNKV